MKERRLNEIRGVILLSLGLIILASLVSFDPYDLGFYTSHPNIPAKNFIRTFGAYLAGILLFLFGWPSYLVPLFVFWLGLNLFRQKPVLLRLPKVISFSVFLLSITSITGIIMTARNDTVMFSRAGFFGFIIAKFIISSFGKLGGYILFTTLAILSVVLVTEVLLSSAFLKFTERLKLILRPLGNIKFRARKKIKVIEKIEKKEFPAILPKPEEKEKISRPKIKIAQESVAELQVKTRPAQVNIGDYRLPSLDLLESPPPPEARQIKEDLANNAHILEDTLDDFGISVKVTDIERGPIITRYELEPAPGVKLNRIVALSDDIALAMKAQLVRIVAPIPGKGKVGVEVPNIQSSFVYLKEVIASKEFQNSASRLTLGLGKDIAGEEIVADLGIMPHLLIAGTTGSGKTVCVNSLILSLLFKATPNELKFLMIDPKMVELAPFNGLPHLLCPVVTEAKKAAVALNWVVTEMEERYQLLAKAGVRNIEAYNERHQTLPYILVIIDEFADLMMVAKEQVEVAVTRLAQLSRAVGIHLILATQRPSVDVVTGVIKANFPARISFKVASKVDSRTVLDMNGADKLLGKGDMLFLKPQETKLIRAQGALVSDKEIERIVEFIKSQAEPIYDEEVLRERQKTVLGGGEKDELYTEAVRTIMESNQASVSILQRRLRLGYTRAARIIDMMEEEGLIGFFEGSKPRKILVDREEWLKEDRKKWSLQEQG